MDDHPRSRPGGRAGLPRPLLLPLSLVPLVMLAAGVATGSWWVALAAVPAAGFFLAAALAFSARAKARRTLLVDRDLAAAQPDYRRSAVWAVAAIASLVVAVLVMRVPG